MEAIFSPFILPAQLHDLPQDYNLRIKLYDVEGNISAQNNLDWFNDFIDLEEVDFEDVKMRLFTQSCRRSKEVVQSPSTSQYCKFQSF